MKRLGFVWLILFTLAACFQSPVIPSSTTTDPLPSATFFPTRTPVPPSPYPVSLEVISPDNIERLEEIDVLGEGRIYSVALSPDEKTIAVYTATGIHLYDSKTLIETDFIDPFDSKLLGSRHPMAFSPDGKFLAFFEDEYISLWNLTNNQRKNWIYSPIEDYKPSKIEFSPQGDHIVITSLGIYRPCDGPGINFALYDLEGRLLFDRYYCDADVENYYRLTPDGKWYIFYSSIWAPFPIELLVVDLDSGSLIESAYYDPDDYDLQDFYYDVSPDGKLLASLESNESIKRTRILDARTREVLQVVDGIIEFYVNENEEIVWREGDGVWQYNRDFNFNEKCEDYFIGRGVSEKIFAFENKAVIYFYPVTLELWNLSTCEFEKVVSYPSAIETAFSPDGRYLASSNRFNLYVWEMKTGQIHFVVNGRLFKEGVDVYAFSRDGERLISGTRRESRSYRLSIWDTQSGRLLRSLQPKGVYLRDVFVTHDNTIILAQDSEGFNFWDIETGELISTIPSGPFAFDANYGQIWVGVGSKDQQKTITLFNYLTGEIIDEIETPYPYNRDMHVSKDGKKLAIISNGLIMLDVETGEELFRIEGSGRFNRSENIIEGDTFFTSGVFYGVTEVWDFEEESPLFSLPDFGPISPDGEMVVTWKNKNSLYFWDLQTGNYLGQIFVGVPANSITFNYNSITFSPDGRLLAITSENGSIYLWGVKSEID